jgi:hypothetical protein
MLALALAAWGWLRPRAQSYMSRFALLLRNDEVVAGTVNGGHVAISPDGRRLVYVGRGDGTSRLFMKEAGQVNPVALQGADGGSSPFFPPDGRQIGFITTGAIVRLLPLDANAPLTLTDKANTTAGDWGIDGVVYFETEFGIARIRATGGAMDTVYAMPKDAHLIGAEWPVVLPGAHAILFRLRGEGQGVADYQIVAQPLPKGAPHVLLRGIYARYSPTGHLVVVTSGGALGRRHARLPNVGPSVLARDGLGHSRRTLSERSRRRQRTGGDAARRRRW